jgi:hypothetical protein
MIPWFLLALISAYDGRQTTICTGFQGHLGNLGKFAILILKTSYADTSKVLNSSSVIINGTCLLVAVIYLLTRCDRSHTSYSLRSYYFEQQFAYLTGPPYFGTNNNEFKSMEGTRCQSAGYLIHDKTSVYYNSSCMLGPPKMQ